MSMNSSSTDPSQLEDPGAVGAGEEKGRWYVGYVNERTQEVMYSEEFSTKTLCAEYSNRVSDTFGLSVMIECFDIPEETAGPEGVDIFDGQTLDGDVATSSALLDARLKDTDKPTITITGDNPAVVVVGGVYNDLGATAHDDVDGNLSSRIPVSGLPVVTLLPSETTVTHLLGKNIKQ